MPYETPRITLTAESTEIIAGRFKTSQCTEAGGTSAKSTSSYEVDE